MINKFHTALGLVSAIIYIISSVVILSTILLYNLYKLPMLGQIYSAAAVLSLSASAGMLYWWYKEEF